MGMEAPAARRGSKFAKGKGKPGAKREGRPERADRPGAKYTPKLLGKSYFQRKKGCPFSGPKAPKIDYKDVRLLVRYVSDFGKIMPRHLSGVSAIKQRELAIAIKRARMIALMGFTNKPEREDRPGFVKREPREYTPRTPRAETPAAAE
jgi:small subunit ribosomal protein S18